MHIRQKTLDTTTVLILEGRFGYTVLEEFQSALKKIEDTHPQHIIIDMSQLVFLDSAAIGRLVATSHRLTKSSIQFTLAGQQGFVDNLLKDIKVGEIIRTVDTVEQALTIPPLAE